MPQKRNPVLCVNILAATARVPALVATILQAQAVEHERGVGGWQLEWSVLPELALLTGGALRQANEVVGGLEVDAKRMRANIEAQRGLLMAESVSMALADKLGRKAAHALVARAARRAGANNMHLRQAIEEDEEISRHFDRRKLDRLFDPTAGFGASEVMIDAALKRQG